ncbi:Uncharacterised protein [Klebsiella pneumoniae]|uniref:Uncharacterized protein n=1 Tax=Klebsiella pneumoniae TaxID=573 RepID=A0A377XCN1_KLEPN|nr:Uncharacterised protein [Klebsiella pneumoniae]
MPCSVIGSSAGGSSPTTGPWASSSPSFFTHGDIAAIVNGAVREQVLQGADDGGALVFGACAEQLQHEKVAKAVDSDARQAIGLAGDQAVAVEAIALGQPGTPGFAPAADGVQRRRYRWLHCGRRSTRGRGSATTASKRRGQPFSLMVNDIDGFTAAGFTFHAGDAAGEYPRMATQQGFLASFG